MESFRIPQNKIDAIIAGYKSGESGTDLSKKHGISLTTTLKILKYNGIEIRNRGYYELTSPDVESRVVDLYIQKEPVKRIVQLTGVSSATINKIIIRNDVKRRGKGFRALRPQEDVFDQITEESAYWVGFLMADGCVSSSLRRISINLQRRDKGHIVKFASFVGATSNIYDTISNSTEQAAITVTSRRLVEALGRFGVVPRKSLIAKVIGLETNRHFWRGVIDGDGSLYVLDGNRIRVSLVGSYDLLIQFRNFVHFSLDCNTVSIHSKANNRAFQLTVCGNPAWRLISLLYQDCGIFMDRRMESAEHILSMPCPKPPLSDDQVREIRRRRESGESLRSIAGDFDISYTMVRFVAIRKYYSSVPD